MMPNSAEVDESELIVNGGFDSSASESNDGLFLEGQEFDGWVMTAAAAGGKRVLQLWSSALGQPLASPFPHGPWAGLNGTITQLVPTEVGASYRLSYLSRAAGWSPHSPASSWAGGNICDVLIDEVVAQTIVSAALPLHTPHAVYFIAQASETTLAFAVIGHNAVGLEQVSLLKIRGREPRTTNSGEPIHRASSGWGEAPTRDVA